MAKIDFDDILKEKITGIPLDELAHKLDIPIELALCIMKILQSTRWTAQSWNELEKECQERLKGGEEV